ncbi:MAG: substrate-binding domain-containing protein [Thermoproteota archaeon]|nr:substrate-binding domain-containing protein [Thermoproteota archaeon]
MSKKKKAAIISLLIIVSVAIAILAITSVAFTPYFRPRSDQPPTPDVAEKTDLTGDDNTSSQTASSRSSSSIPTTINVVSTTSAFPFVQRWAAEYENQQATSSVNVDLEYLTDREIKEDKAEDSGLAVVGVPDENGASYIPLSPQAVSIVYNIPSFPDIPSGLRLNFTTLFLMLNGSINQWNDAAIKDLNPNLNLPNEKIIIVHNSDDNNNNSSNSSSSLLLLNRYLGSQDIINWPSDSIAASGPAELAETVRKIPYSVGYVDFSYAVQTRMTYAAIGNADGDYILPSTQSIGQAVNLALQFHNSSTNGSTSSQQQQQPPTLNASRLVNGSYPIVGLYYGSLLANHDEEERNASILDFVEWLISDRGGQQTLLEVQYPPIYPSNNEQLETYAKAITDTIIPN